VANRLLDPTYASIGSAALPRESKRPLAAFLYIDFVLSMESQKWRPKIANYLAQK
jgi:ABC-type Fe3+ transport system substrate-binding protein